MAKPTFAPPRTSRYMGMAEAPTQMGKDTWLEAECFCYPGGGMHRRGRALCADGKLRIFRCGIPDTFFSIPVKGGGWLTIEDGVLTYHAPKGTTK